MKKSLFALAVLGAFSGMAAAQSSVTLFGIVDANVRWTDNNGTKLTELGNSGLASSRLGFRGVEDLGGGLKAGFWLESAVNNDDGTSNATRFWHRRSTISLMGGFGEVRLGRDLVPTFTGYADFDPFGTNGVADVGRLHTNLASLPAASRPAVDTLVRADNMVSYFLPSTLGGFYGQVSVAAGEGTVGKKYIGGRLGYSAGPLNVGGFYGQTESTGDEDFKTGGIAAMYDFGAFKLNGIVSENKFLSAKERHFTFGGSVPVGAGLIRASYTKVQGRGSIDGSDADQFALGYVHNLSKRTAVYTTVAIIKNDGNATYSVGGRNTALVRGGEDDSKGFELGVRHSF
ncbi:MAG: porin [Aquincola tertiaricarbonis]|uniref:porin n=1 Tax=Aquincola TaxID=391952 RepID=UPI00061527AC|nr:MULTISPECIES: porin [Aquincola]MCR5865626.1 porin [Aquincola sp. J276]